MKRLGVLGVTLLLLTWFANPAFALITRLTAIQDMLSEATLIVVTRVERLDPKRPGMVLAVDSTLKGKPTWTKAAVLLQGDGRSRKLKEQPQLLARLENGLPIVLFINKLENDYVGFAYTNGTWFSLAGTTVDGEVRWAFSHLEPYLRRTYKGTTAEIITTIKEGLSGKKKPPAPDAKEKPGLGPEVKSKKSTWIAPARPHARAVIPTVLVGGPLALLAMLFPTVFGGWQRWLALLSTAGTNCTLVSLQWWFQEDLVGSWWGSPAALWTSMSVVNLLGLGWAWYRHLRMVQLGEAPLLVGWIEFGILLVMSLLGVGALIVCRWLEQPLFSPIWLPMVVFIIAVWLALLYVAWTWLRGPRLIPALATETVLLTGLTGVSILLAPAMMSRVAAGGLETGEGTARQSLTIEPIWTFKLPEKGAIASSPVVMGDRVLIGAALDAVFRPYGALYCLEKSTGKLLWTFHDGKKMKQVYSTPVVMGDRIFIGEGFHQDYDCKVYCLDAKSGKKLWEYETASHTESTASVVDGKVYIGAGDDGIYCLTADHGEKVWNFPGFHIDASPLLVKDRVYVGCGIGDAFKTTALFCLDAATGKPRWRYAATYAVWNKPLLSGEQLFFATGNGRINEPAINPAGEVLCLRADTGEEIWTKKLPDGVFARMRLDQDSLFVGCRDGNFYALRRSDGGMVWRRNLGSAVVSAPILETCPCCQLVGNKLYVASLAGLLVCLDKATGEVIWSKDLIERTRIPIELISTPALDVRHDEETGTTTRRLYVAITLISSARAGELHCYEERFVE